MTSMPLISVVITCYNIRNYVSDAIRSVQAQSYNKLEILVVDDGSTDGTGEVVASFEAVRYLRQENGGPSSARNTGIANSKGNVIAFLDGDDIWESDKLMRQVDALVLSPAAGMVFSDFSTFDTSSVIAASKNKSLFKHLEPIQYKYLVSRNNFIYPSTVIVRKECFERCGVFDETLCGPEDWEMWLRIARYFAVVGVNAPLAWIRQHPTNISSNVSAMLDNERRAIHKQLPYLGRWEYLKRVARLYLLNADRCIHNGSRLQAIQLMAQGFVLYPLLFVPFCIVLAKLVVGGNLAQAMRRSINNIPYIRALFEFVYKKY